MAASADLTLRRHDRAILNILEDFTAERVRLGDTQKAMLNILDDFGDEKARLEATQRAVLNILEDIRRPRETRLVTFEARQKERSMTRS